MKSARRPLLTAVLLSALLATFAVGVAWFTSPTRADVDCSGDWGSSTDPAVLEACGKLKAIAGPTQIASDMATMTSGPFVLMDPNYTPEAILPEPDDFKVVKAVPVQTYTSPDGNQDFGTMPPREFAGASTVWEDGSVPSTDYKVWNPLYVLTRPGNGASYDTLWPGTGVITVTTNPTLETIVFANPGGEDTCDCMKVWTDPHTDGALYITNITNPDYTNTDPTVPYPGVKSVVYFTTASGQTGHFDMSTETWTFDSMSGPVATPTAPLAYP